MVSIIIALSAALLTLIAELLHKRRSQNIEYLVFHGAKPSSWTWLALPLRSIGMGLCIWGFTVLLQFDSDKSAGSNTEEAEIDPKKLHHIVVVLDVSPSMQIKDAGSQGQKSRSQRAIEVTQAVMKRIPEKNVRYSLVSVYTDARPIVIDSRDRQIITNLMDFTMDHVFTAGKTKLIKGIESAFKLTEQQNWPDSSATVLMISDGDTIPYEKLPPRPPAVSDFIIAGIGSPSGKFIDGHTSRQDSTSLRRLASQYGGRYQDSNNQHLSSENMGRLAEESAATDLQEAGLKEYALLASIIGAIILSALPLLLEYFGFNWQHIENKRSLPGFDTEAAS